MIGDQANFAAYSAHVHVKRRYLAVVITVAVLVLTACGHSATKQTAQLDASYTPQKSLSDAVTAILSAEQKSNAAASFALLAPDARNTYKDTYAWTKRLQELPVVTGFHLEGAKDSTQTVTVTHTPSLDAYIGLSPASETQMWVGKQFSKGWLLEPDPNTVPILPSDAAAPAAAKAWVEAVQACDKDKAHSLQAISDLLATSTPAVCGTSAPVVVGAATQLTDSPESAQLVAQYTTDSLEWARSVAVSSPAAFHVILAPIGNDWRVVGIY